MVEIPELPWPWASNGTFGPRYEIDLVELGHRVAVRLLTDEILGAITEDVYSRLEQ